MIFGWSLKIFGPKTFIDIKRDQTRPNRPKTTLLKAHISAQNLGQNPWSYTDKHTVL